MFLLSSVRVCSRNRESTNKTKENRKKDKKQFSCKIIKRISICYKTSARKKVFKKQKYALSIVIDS